MTNQTTKQSFVSKEQTREYKTATLKRKQHLCQYSRLGFDNIPSLSSSPMLPREIEL